MTAYQTFVQLSMPVGLALGTCVAVYLASRILRHLSRRSRSPALVLCAGIAGGLLASFPAFFGSIVVGGHLGGALAAWGLGEAYVPLGLFLGIALVLALIV